MQSVAITTEKQLSRAKELMQRPYCHGGCSRIGAVLVNEAEGAFDARMQWPVGVRAYRRGGTLGGRRFICLRRRERERNCTLTERKNPRDDRWESLTVFHPVEQFRSRWPRSQDCG